MMFSPAVFANTIKRLLFANSSTLSKIQYGTYDNLRNLEQFFLTK